VKVIKRVLAACGVIVLVWHGFFTSSAQEKIDTLTTDTNLVTVYLSVVDRQTNFLTSLSRDDIKVYEDGIEQRISTFQQATDRPVSIALLMDISGSERNTLSREKSAAKSFAAAVIQRPIDQLAVISFAADPFLEHSLTNTVKDADEAIERIGRIQGTQGYQGSGEILPAGSQPAGGTLSYTSAIWDAVWITCRYVMAAQPLNSRKVVVLVTDGEDTSSRANLDEAIDIAIKTDAMVYVIGIGDNSIADGVNRSTLSKLATSTGGQVFFPRKDEDLGKSFQKIAQDLRSHYVVTYVPRRGNVSERSFREIRIELTNSSQRARHKMFYRKGYYFPQTHVGT
jgi:Ca-activated chloride channel family protein